MKHASCFSIEYSCLRIIVLVTQPRGTASRWIRKVQGDGSTSQPSAIIQSVCTSACSRPSTRDDFDEFGGRETPHILRRSSLTGGGEEAEGAIEELRRELEITEVLSSPFSPLAPFPVLPSSHSSLLSPLPGFPLPPPPSTHTTGEIYHFFAQAPRLRTAKFLAQKCLSWRIGLLDEQPHALCIKRTLCQTKTKCGRFWVRKLCHRIHKNLAGKCYLYRSTGPNPPPYLPPPPPGLPPLSPLLPASLHLPPSPSLSFRQTQRSAYRHLHKNQTTPAAVSLSAQS